MDIEVTGGKDKKTNSSKPTPKDQTKRKGTISDGLSEADLLSVIDAEVDHVTLVGHHMDSFNNFVSTGINQIITQLFTIEKTIQNERTKTPEDNEIAFINFVVKF